MWFWVSLSSTEIRYRSASSSSSSSSKKMRFLCLLTEVYASRPTGDGRVCGRDSHVSDD